MPNLEGMVGALLDVVPEFLGIKEWKEVEFFGRLARFPTGLLSTAARSGATIVPFFGRVGTDHHWELSFEEPCRVTELGETLFVLIGLLKQYIRDYPYDWYHWPALQDFYHHAGWGQPIWAGTHGRAAPGAVAPDDGT